MRKAVRTVDSLTDAEIESCFDGSTNVRMVRALLEQTVDKNGIIHDADFGDLFAEEIEGFIGVDQDEDPEGWREAWKVNQEWGERIADNVNDLLIGESNG
jgi:hypothetical protein